MRSLARPQSAFMGGLDENNSAMGNGERLNPMTEAGDDIDEEHQAQMKFVESMRASTMDFFKTAKSTFMSTNDIQSSSMVTDSYHAWADRPGSKPEKSDNDESDLAANAD